MLSKLQHVLLKKALTSTYYATFHSHLLYGIPVWDGTFKSYLSRIASLQNKAVKIISGANYQESANPYYKDLNILKVTDLYKLEVAKLMHRCVHNNFPNTFLNFFVKTREIHPRSTRLTPNKLSLHIPRYKTSRLQRNFKHQRVKIWNSIPQSQQNLTFSRFKLAVKSKIFSLLTNKTSSKFIFDKIFGS